MKKIVDETLMPVNLKGAVFAPGLAIGHIIFHEPRVEILKFKSKNSSKELQRLEKALTDLRKDIDKKAIIKKDKKITPKDLKLDFKFKICFVDIINPAKIQNWVIKIIGIIKSGVTAKNLNIPGVWA